MVHMQLWLSIFCHEHQPQLISKASAHTSTVDSPLLTADNAHGFLIQHQVRKLNGYLIVLLSMSWCCVNESCAAVCCDVVATNHQRADALIQGVLVVTAFKALTLECG